MPFSSFWLVADLPHLLAQGVITALLGQAFIAAMKNIPIPIRLKDEDTPDSFDKVLEELFQYSESLKQVSHREILEMLIQARIPIVFLESEAYWTGLIFQYIYDLSAILALEDNPEILTHQSSSDYPIFPTDYLSLSSNTINSDLLTNEAMTSGLQDFLIGQMNTYLFSESTSLSAALLLQQFCSQNCENAHKTLESQALEDTSNIDNI